MGCPGSTSAFELEPAALDRAPERSVDGALGAPEQSAWHGYSPGEAGLESGGNSDPLS